MEQKQDVKNYRKPPRFYQDLMGGLLVAYSSAPEASRYIIANDILGYVNSVIVYTKKADTKYQDKIIYSNLMNDLFEKLQSAITYFKDGESATSDRLLNEVVWTLKVIIMTENMVTDNWEHTANPLSTANAEHDRIANAIYRDIE